MSALFRHIFRSTQKSLRRFFQQLTLLQVAYLAILVVLLVLPYFLFGTRMHVEGDDSHLYFHYPELWLQHIADSSWMSFSSAGKQDQHFFLLPILYLFWGLKLLGIPSFVIQNLSFSVIFILGFVFFQKLLNELLPRKGYYRTELLFGAMMYIFSPILLITPLRSYLAPIWLIGALPLMAYLLVRYLKTGQIRYVAISGICGALFSVAFNALPWLLGCILPIVIGGLSGLLVFSWAEKKRLFKRLGLWLMVVALCQAFWLSSFAGSLGGSNSLGGRIFNEDVKQSFSRTVLATDRGNTIIDPLLNLFHRQIQQDFGWNSHSTYREWHDPLIPITVIYIVILMLGLLFGSQYAGRTYWLLVSGLLVALFLFTVRIGWLEQLFLAAGNLPGFAMFRNFYNKFALGYVLLYAAIITFSLVYIRQGLKQKHLRTALLVVGFLAIMLNAKPFFTGEIINANLQDTAHVQRNLFMPEEYLSFMKAAGKAVPPNTNLFDIPFGTSAYTIIPETGSNHAYSGKSPVKLFSGVNDFSGNLSFTPVLARQVNDAIMERDYVRLKHLLRTLNINYIFETKNIPSELIESSLFDENVLTKIDARFREQMYGEQLLTSKAGNYVLYKIKDAEQADSFLAASAVYTFPSALLNAREGALSGPLGYLLDAANIGVEENTETKLLVKDQVKPFSWGQKVDNAAKSAVYVPHHNFYQVVSSDSKGLLKLQNIAQSAYTQDSPSTATVSVGPLSAANLVQINNDFYTQSELSGAVVNSNESLAVLEKGRELTGGTAKVYQSWVPGDCSAQNKEKATSVNYNTATTELALKGKDQQNACLFSDLSTDKLRTYLISFEYKTNTAGVTIAVTQRDSVTQKNKITASPFRPARNGQWNTFTYAFRINEGSARLYLFSGKHSQEAVTSLRNIQIHELNSVRSVNLTDAGLLSTGPNAYEAGSISTQAMTQSQVPVPPLADWRQGDCNALDDTPTVDFTHLDDGIELTGRDGHNACIRLITDINTNYSYSIDFDYYSTGVSGDFKLAYMYDPDFPLKKYAEPRVQNQWRHVTLRPSTPEEATNLTLYLYSGTNKKGTAGVKYRNFTIKRLPKTFTDNSLITHNTSANSEQKVKSIEIAPHLYKVTATSVTSGFFINFLEPYHDGWQLAVEGNKSDSSKIIPFHLAANLETNAWYVDVDKLCKVQKLCQTNSDGSYSIAMVATFTPHRYFYLGVGVSGIALVGCLGYLLWSRWRRRQR